MKLFDVLKAGAGLPVEDPLAVLFAKQMAGTSFVTEMQGVPPLQIVSAGKPLTAYRIYGNSVQEESSPAEVRSVEELVTEGELEEGSEATAYELYGYKLPVVVTGKNLFNKNGAFIDGYLGSEGNIEYIKSVVWKTTNYFIKCSGLIAISAINGIGVGTYITCYDMEKKYLGSVQQGISNNTTNTIQLVKGTEYIKTCCRENNFDSYQIELGTEFTAYEPYHEPVTTNIYLDEPLASGDVLSYPENILKHADGTAEPVTLPNIPTFDGTTVITVDTKIQPSSMYVKYNGKR